MKRRIILASGSPRRRDILTKMGLEFDIIPSSYEEVLESLDFTYEKIEKLAYYKAKAVAESNAVSTSILSLIIGADTVVVLGNKILGKPQDEGDAICTLKALSGKKHSVVTSICALNTENSERKILSTTSYVEFNVLSDNLIKDYVQNYKPLDKAGSYGIQELPEGFVKTIEGSFENIIGLCPLAVKEILQQFK